MIIISIFYIEVCYIGTFILKTDLRFIIYIIHIVYIICTGNIKLVVINLELCQIGK